MTIEGDFVQTFLGQCKGVGLQRRGPTDPHVCLTLLTEDDGNWFPSDQPFSSYWSSELSCQLLAAEHWMQDNCDPDMHDGRAYGWKFRENAKSDKSDTRTKKKRSR